MTVAPPLTPLEIASGVLLGQDDDSHPLPEVDSRLTPLQALRDAVLPALERPPCLVSFSGGRDSSAVLALAADVARREGLDPPIPVTLRFPCAPETEESGWQEAVIAHLGIAEWTRLVFRDELDWLGPVAQVALRRHGLLWPSNAHFHLPILEQAHGGSVLTGADGEILGWWRCARAAAVVSRRTDPVPGDLVRIGIALAPATVRRAWLRKRHPLRLRWLRPNARRAVERASSDEEARQPLSWRKHIERYARAREVSVGRAGLQALADGTGSLMVHPFLDRRFLAALARAGGRLGVGERHYALRALFGELLPPSILDRKSKAIFTGAFWGPFTRAFVERWPGGGVPSDIVDEARLRAEWRAPVPHFLSSLSLQALWLTAPGSWDLDRHAAESV
jgi:hypothetical protein